MCFFIFQRRSSLIPGDAVDRAVSFHVPASNVCPGLLLKSFLYHRNEKKKRKKKKKRKQPKFRCSAAILNTQGEVAMETELHWPEMKASEDLDFHCT